MSVLSSAWKLTLYQPQGAVGVVTGGRTEDGTWYQIMLWRSGVPVFLGRSPAAITARAIGHIIRLHPRYRGKFVVIVRRDPEFAGDFFDPQKPGKQMWRLGPWSRSEAMLQKAALNHAIDSGEWDPARSDVPPDVTISDG